MQNLIKETENLFDIIKNALFQGNFIKLTMSNPFKKTVNFHKITIEHKKRTNKNTDKSFYQFTFYFDTKVKHENYDAYGAVSRLKEILYDYKQCDFNIAGQAYKVLINKKGTCKIFKQKDIVSNNVGSHNTVKSYILQENIYIEWLHRLGVMNKEGRILADKQKKFRQINKFLEIISDVYKNIPDNANIIDFGCGKAYLTFAMYDYLVRIKEKKARITGIDIKKSVINECSNIATELNMNGLFFTHGRIEDYKNSENSIDMVVCLHACDTATDYALEFAIKNNAKVILCAPCCQHELYSQIENDILKPMLKHGILKERFSALLTDSLRAMILEICGYRCQVMEFIDAEHTPKNIMIRAIKKTENRSNNSPNKELISQFLFICNQYSINPKLYDLVKDMILEK